MHKIFLNYCKGKIDLFRSFWLIAMPFSLAYSYESMMILPKPYYTYTEESFAPYVRMFFFTAFSIFGIIAIYGTLRSAKNYQGHAIWKVLTSIYCYTSLAMIAFSLYLGFTAFPYLIKGQDPYLFFT